jgi:hypothetical protein
MGVAGEWRSFVTASFENQLSFVFQERAARLRPFSTVSSRAAEKQKAEVVGVGCYEQATPNGVKYASAPDPQCALRNTTHAGESVMQTLSW